MKMSLEKKANIGFLGALVIIIIISLVSYFSISKFTETNSWVKHTVEVKEKAEGLLTTVIDIETGTRGYVISGSSIYLEPYYYGLRVIDKKYTDLKKATKDNLVQQKNLKGLKLLLDERIKFAEQVIHLRENNDFEGAKKLIVTGRGKELTDKIRKIIAKVQNEESRLLDIRMKEVNVYSTLTEVVFLSLGILLFVFLGVLYFFLQKDAVEENRFKKTLEASDAKFKALIEQMPDAIVIVNKDGQIVLVNAQSEKSFGYTKDEMLGNPIEILIPTALTSKHIEHRSKYVSSPQKRTMGTTMNLQAKRKDGSIFPVDIELGPVETQEGLLIIATVKDITERKKIDEYRSRLSAIIESSDDAITGKTLDGIITSWNKGAEALYGYSSEEVIGKHFFLIVPPACKSEVTEIMERIKEDKKIEHHETQRIRKDGKIIDVSLTISPIKDFQNNIIGISTIARDITERKETEEKIKALNENLKNHTVALEATNKELEAFSYSVSHDLRAPLRSIDGFSQALLEDCSDKVDEQGKDYLNRIRAATQRMAELIDDMLNLSKVTRAEMHMKDIDLSKEAHKIMDELKTREPERKVDFFIADGLNTKGDPTLLRAVLQNLFDNAWKFTSKHPHAKIEFGAMRQENGEKVFFVKDDGVGFDMNYSNKLFGVFQRLHGMTEFSGTGVGLATVQRIIRRHGGKVWAEGVPEGGATFYFVLDEKVVDGKN